jgi:branched-chain amino acid transport system ATP-binding protein
MLLSVKNLVVRYGALEVLKGVSMDIAQGGISVLLGANGSGKSTLFKAISGIHPIVSGHIWFNGLPIEGMSTANRVRAGISHVAEGKKIFKDMTVMENLELGAYLTKTNKEKKRDIEEKFERFPALKRKKDVKSEKLSGGEQQIVAISRALMTKPKLLLLDEPSQGLAPLIVNEVAGAIIDIAKSDITILIIEHNRRLGLSLAHRVIVLESGIIAFESDARDLSGVEYAKRIYLGG